MSYRVMVTREGGNWLAEVPELPGAHTYARRLDALDAEVREVIAAMLDLPEGAEPTLELTYTINSGAHELDARVEKLRLVRAAIHEAERKLAQETADVTAELLANQHTMREAAFRIGVSGSRISQIKQERLAS